MHDDDEKKPGRITRFFNWVKLQRQLWLRRNIIKKIAKLTPIGEEISLEKFLGVQTETKANMPAFYITPAFNTKVLEHSKTVTHKCEHGEAVQVTHPKKIECTDASVCQVMTDEECQKAFRDLYEQQLHPVRRVVCPHCKKQSK